MLYYLALVVIAGVMTSILGYLTYEKIIIDDYTERLQRDADQITQILLGEVPSQEQAGKIAVAAGVRMTIISHDGTVMVETDSNASDMGNHADRPEIVRAKKNPYGVEVRYSETLGANQLYVAKSIAMGTKQATLRVSINLSHILQKFWEIMLDVLIVVIMFALMALVITLRMSKRIQSDVESINKYLDAIGGKNYKSVLKVSHFQEFLQISLQLKNVIKRLRQREKQRRKYTAKLRLINQQRSDILSALSHEFKNPIAVIVGYAETLRDDEEAAPQIRRRFLEKILSNADKMSGMLDRLSFSVKLENNDLKMRMDNFDMAEVCSEVTTNMQKKYLERDLVCDVDSTPVYGDRHMLELVMTNLVDNALKYSDERVEIVLKNGVVRVVDYGLGIPEKEIENITSKYYRVVKNTWDNSMGLGLSIVTYILKQHHTKLKISSERGDGSVFSFDLDPMHQSAQEDTMPAEAEKEEN